MNVGGTTRVEIDRGKCCGYALCAEICPEVYELDESGIAVANLAEIPDDLLGRARSAAQTCPEGAIRLTTD